jgi:hypothetical protein
MRPATASVAAHRSALSFPPGGAAVSLVCARSGRAFVPPRPRFPPGPRTRALGSAPSSRPSSHKHPPRPCPRMPASARTGSSVAGTKNLYRAQVAQSAAVNSACRGRRLTGKPVTESNLSPHASAQRAAVLGGEWEDDGIGRTYADVVDRASQQLAAAARPEPSVARRSRSVLPTAVTVYVCAESIPAHVVGRSSARTRP